MRWLPSLDARTRRPRDEAIRALLDALAPHCDVVDTRAFSGLLLVLTLETTCGRLARLAEALQAIGVPLTADSAARVAAAVREADEPCAAMLDVTFVDGDADLRHPVPKVPG